VNAVDAASPPPRAHPGRVLFVAWLPAALYMLLIWTLSSRQLNLPLDKIPWQDKGVHAVEYALLGACFAHAVWISWPRRGVRGWLSAWLFATSFGLLDELHQAFVPGRSADVLDLAADALGAALAVTAFWVVRTWLATRRQAA